MKTVAVCSSRGAPGVTTTCLLLAAQLQASVLLEADLCGGVLAVRYGLGREPGLVTLAAAHPHDPDGWLDHAQDAGGVPVLVGPDSAEAAQSLWRSAGGRLTAIIQEAEGMAVVDCGRLWGRTQILDDADVVLVVTRPSAEEIVSTSHAIGSLHRTKPSSIVVALVGDGPYRASDVQEAVDCPVLCHLPEDRPAAQHLRDGGASRRSLTRTRLVRAVAGLGEALAPIVTSVPEKVSVR
jgi:MinD-like ATPase involved in chromosome partitioning or flagellar assembly